MDLQNYVYPGDYSPGVDEREKEHARDEKISERGQYDPDRLRETLKELQSLIMKEK
jgi:hypothetical protein